MSKQPHQTLVDFYRNRLVFVTGATGMLGTAYISRLVLDTPVTRVYALARGGESRLWDIWRKYLPSDMVQALQKSNKLVILDGDITHPQCGLDAEEIKMIQDNVSIFVHGASTINLRKTLAKIAPQIVHPSLELAKMALGCSNLTQFVYISTAYSSIFLREMSDGSISGFNASIKEDINPIRSDDSVSAAAELSDLNAFGSTPEYEFVMHPTSYTYCKHLTERLILDLFKDAQAVEKLLIFRPSFIGPAISNPSPFFEIPGSSPGTSWMAAVLTSPPTKLACSTYLSDPSLARFDEVPVDVVVNRLIVHVAFGSNGCVHAVAGAKHQRSMETFFNNTAKLRSQEEGYPELVWINDDWKSDKQWHAARLYLVTGCRFEFEERKTELVWERMTDIEQSSWPLWPTVDLSSIDYLAGRKETIKSLISQFMAKSRMANKPVSRL